MIKLAFLLLFFLLSLLVLFRAPTNLLWYVSILITEFSWVFITLIVFLLFWKQGSTRLSLISTLLGIATLAILSLPYWQAWRLSQKIKNDFLEVSNQKNVSSEIPFNLLKIFTGTLARKLDFQQFTYDYIHHLTLDFYSSKKRGLRPCIVVIHGGSWAAGDSQQLPELNSELAKEGYHVASINYRMAPTHQYPAPIEDVNKALHFLKQKANELSIDSSDFVLIGRSAGGQIALVAAYTLHEPSIKGVVNFYGPTDMVWGYENPTNPLVLDSRKIMEDYLGGTLNQVQQKYIHSSATEIVTTKTPPTLMIYGENDPLVSPYHGTRLSVKLKAMGIPHYELYLPWATHGFDYTLNGPAGQLSTWMTKRFLEEILSKRD